MKKGSRTSKKGFTLVELLVVIGIIGLLAAIILPKFTGYTGKAVMKDAVSQARTTYTEISAYYAEKGSYPIVSEAPATTDKTAINNVVTTIVNVAVNHNAPAAGASDGNYLEYYVADAAGADPHKMGDFNFYLVKGGKVYKVMYREGKITEGAIP